MPNIDIGLNAKLSEFRENFGIKETEEINKVFEQFSNYIIVSKELQREYKDINKVSTGTAEGIDGIGIIVNDMLIADESDLDKIGQNEKLTVKLVFIQSTTQGSFESKKFASFVDSVVSFLLREYIIEPFSDIYKKLLDDEGDFIDNLKDTPEIALYFTSAKTNHNIDSSFLEEQRRKIINREELAGRVKLGNNMYFLQKEEIKKMYDNIAKYNSVTVKFSKNTDLYEKDRIKKSLIGAMRFEDLKKLVLTEDGNLKESLFVENPRSFLKNTSVNDSMKRTLDNESDRPYFVYLNNGLTILCKTVERAPVRENEFVLKYPRIINGCQTTHILFEEYKNGKRLDDVEIVVKVIATDDDELKKKIIFAANNQNSISDDLQSLNEYHKDIEEFFNGFEGIKLRYERLRGQYPDVKPPYKKINIENLAKVYISVFLQEPHKMKSHAIKKIEEYQRDKKIFANSNEKDVELKKYYFSALLYYWLEKFITNKIITLKSKTMDMHLLMACNLFLEKLDKRSIDDKIKHLQKEDKAKSLFSDVISFLESQKYLFDRRGFYSGPKTKRLIEAIKGSQGGTTI